MKKIGLIMLFILYCLNLFSQKELYDLSGDKIKIDYKQPTIAIAYSTASCHSCYDDINRFFEKEDVYHNFNIIIFANIEEKNNKDIRYKRNLYDKMKGHFPLCNNIYFNTKTKGKEPVFFSKTMNDYLLPNIFIIKNKKLDKYYSSSNLFLKYFELNKILNEK